MLRILLGPAAIFRRAPSFLRSTSTTPIHIPSFRLQHRYHSTSQPNTPPFIPTPLYTDNNWTLGIMTVHGSCLCGQVTIRLEGVEDDGEVKRIALCHCKLFMVTALTFNAYSGSHLCRPIHNRFLSIAHHPNLEYTNANDCERGILCGTIDQARIVSIQADHVLPRAFSYQSRTVM